MVIAHNCKRIEEGGVCYWSWVAINPSLNRYLYMTACSEGVVVLLKDVMIYCNGNFPILNHHVSEMHTVLAGCLAHTINKRIIIYTGSHARILSRIFYYVYKVLPRGHGGSGVCSSGKMWDFRSSSIVSNRIRGLVMPRTIFSWVVFNIFGGEAPPPPPLPPPDQSLHVLL